MKTIKSYKTKFSNTFMINNNNMTFYKEIIIEYIRNISLIKIPMFKRNITMIKINKYNAKIDDIHTLYLYPDNIYEEYQTYLTIIKNIEQCHKLL